MASIEKRGKSYRIIFRFQGQRYTRSLHTRSEKNALGALHRLEDNLRWTELGTLTVPLSPFIVEVLTEWFEVHPGGMATFAVNCHLSKGKKFRLEPTAVSVDEASHHFEHTVKKYQMEAYPRLACISPFVLFQLRGQRNRPADY